jgi:hypothetical protein
MKHLLSILLRNQFNLFYRFGYTYIPKCQLLEFDGVISESTKEDLTRLFSETTPFEWEEEYLIIHFDKNELVEVEVYQFQIQDIVNVYPLSAQAKSSIETKIDQRIKLEKPVFENILPKVEQTIEKHELEKAIEALWKVCDIDDDLSKYIANIDLDNIFNGLERRKKGTKSNQIKDGNYWEYVIAYDRFDYFPNSTLGYFYDAGQIFANSKGLPTFEGSALYKFLQSINSSEPNIRIKEIIKLLETEEQGKKYVYQTSSNEQLQYLITPLYLMLRDEIRKADDVYNTNLYKHLKSLKEFGESFNYAVILLGAFFGFKKFYDVYYDHLNLRFYKSYQPKRGKKEVIEEAISEKSFISLEQPISEEKPLDKGEPITVEQEILSQDTKKTIKELEIRENPSSELESEILPKDDVKENLAKKPVEPQTKLKDETETVIKLRGIINELLNAKSEMKLSDIGEKIKEDTGQKVTNTIIKNVINSMDNIEIVPKKKPETARQLIMQDLFNKQE